MKIIVAFALALAPAALVAQQPARLGLAAPAASLIVLGATVGSWAVDLAAAGEAGLLALLGNVSLTFGQTGVDNVSSTFGNVVRQTLQKNLNVQPTIEVRPGYRFNVIVEKDIVFPPYAP